MLLRVLWSTVNGYTESTMNGERSRCLEAAEQDTVGVRLPDGNEVFDQEAFRARLDGDEELCREILDIFLNDTQIQIEKLARALQDGEAAMVRLQAHCIRGAAANVCAQSIRRVAFSIETQAALGRLEGLGLMCRNLEQQFERFKGTVPCTP